MARVAGNSHLALPRSCSVTLGLTETLDDPLDGLGGRGDSQAQRPVELDAHEDRS